MKQHTKEPWNYSGEEYPLLDAYNNLVHLTEHKERIATCINACAGINPEAVPDLLWALEKIVGDCTDPITGKIEWAGEVASAAIAKTKQ